MSKQILLQLLVFTDLDGTLLDHDDYSFAAAQSALTLLHENLVPVIPVTSKTCAELLELRQALNNSHPFVVENGAAIYYPENYFPHKIDSAKNADDRTQAANLEVFHMGRSRAYWCELLDSLEPSLKSAFLGFKQLGVEGIVAETGLPIDSAERANQRQASEPLKWLGSDELLTRFITNIKSHGGQVLRGGRFLHILDSSVSKGNALKWLVQQYGRKYSGKRLYSVALGDAENDLSMLAAADQPVVIRSQYHALPDTSTLMNVMISEAFGPSGWNETIHKILGDKLADA